ncbi:hypothetical protein, partial [Acetobacter oeni]|uniref:hypothetical protein n=1 Tax=Acetobacter oeni TaxID=304077 RepID=UPI0022327DFE
GTQRGQDFSIKPLESVHVLTNEFRPALSDERIASLAQLFPGVWEPIGPVMPLLADTDHSPAATKAAIRKGLDALAEQIEHLPAQDEEQPWTGSNHPPEPLDEPEPPPIRPEDKEQALAAMSEVRHLVWADASLQAIRAAWGKLSLFLAKVGAWAAQQIRNYLPELIKGGVQQAGKDGFEYLAAAIRSCDLGQMIGRWIRDLFS